MRTFRSSQAVDTAPLAAGDIHRGELAVSRLLGLGLWYRIGTPGRWRLFLWRHCLPGIQPSPAGRKALTHTCTSHVLEQAGRIVGSGAV